MEKFVIEYTVGKGTPRLLEEVAEEGMIEMVQSHYRKELFIHRIDTTEGETLYDYDAPDEDFQDWA